MTYGDYLARVIDQGIEAARHDYGKPEDKARLEGSIEGFKACRGKKPGELAQLLADARRDQASAFDRNEPEAYWRVACRAAEIEWVANCVSAVQILLHNEPPIVPATARGTMKMAQILRDSGDGSVDLP